MAYLIVIPINRVSFLIATKASYESICSTRSIFLEASNFQADYPINVATPPSPEVRKMGCEIAKFNNAKNVGGTNVHDKAGTNIRGN